MHPTHQPAMWPQTQIQWLRVDDHHVRPVKASAANYKSQSRLAFMGQEFLNKTSYGSNTPWFLFLFFISFLFIFF